MKNLNSSFKSNTLLKPIWFLKSRSEHTLLKTVALH